MVVEEEAAETLPVLSSTLTRVVGGEGGRVGEVVGRGRFGGRVSSFRVQPLARRPDRHLFLRKSNLKTLAQRRV